jgi:hypothetical protein
MGGTKHEGEGSKGEDMKAGIPKGFWWAIVSVALMLAGAFGPWAKVLFITINGTDGGRDGWVVVGAAGVAALVLLAYLRARKRWLAVIPLLAGCLGVVTAGYDISDINGTFGGGVASAEWGIYLALIASVSLVLASLALILRSRRKTQVTDAETGQEAVA